MYHIIIIKIFHAGLKNNFFLCIFSFLRCGKCDCNGNVDSNAIGNCDSLTGGCLKCIYNTTNGDDGKCEECAEGFYGDALALPKGNCTGELLLFSLSTRGFYISFVQVSVSIKLNFIALILH